MEYNSKDIKLILNELLKGNISIINSDTVNCINRMAMEILNEKFDKECANDILHISNILYNNTDNELLPLDDGVYDLLLERYKREDPNWQVGAEPINFAPSSQIKDNEVKKEKAMMRINKEMKDEILFFEDIYGNIPIIKTQQVAMTRTKDHSYISKRNVNMKHNYPKLVGTLDKCKFVLSEQARNKGVYNDSNVKIVERDFFGRHISDGILDPNRRIRILITIKYDGISVEGDVTNIIVGARTRGDANEDIAADITPILEGYRFPLAPKEMWNQQPFGMKFEAVMTYRNLEIFNQMKGREYKNCRTAIIGLFGSSDAAKYKDLITLVPLATSLESINRMEEVDFMNTFYTSGENLRYAVLEGTYVEVLFQIKRFVEEAEMMRPYMPFLYDGVVIEYLEEDLIQKLGRVNAVNKYAMAIKFNPLKRQTIFRGYKYTVGEHGTVTPAIYFDPIEFLGAIHDHTSGHSYERFKNLQLRIGDILDVEYVNDVMPYATKPDNSHNAENVNPIVEFIDECPSCGTKLLETDSGKNKYCPNIQCPQRNLMRIVNMMKKLNLKDFSEAQLSKIGMYTLSEMLNVTYKDVEFLGDVTSQKFLDRMNQIKTEPIYDYNIVGSLGIELLGRRKWKLIFAKYTLAEIMSMNEEQLKEAITSIKGLGLSAVNTLLSQMEFFKDDLETILSMNNVVSSKGSKSGKKIRMTGFRDKELIEYLNSLGHDASDSSVTKDTDILLVPLSNYTSGSKVSKAIKYGVQIIPVQDFRQDMEKYL